LDAPAEKVKALTPRGKYTAVTKALMLRLVGTFVKDATIPKSYMALE
jgi:hypothetical protein